MADLWKKLFETEVGGRPVKGDIYDEGGYKITTKQKSDYEGIISKDEFNTVIIPPADSGTPIEIDAETLDELERELIEHGEFSPEEAKAIVSMF
ncbi:MAG: hypothetical protein JRJ54_16045 [Deltaproteobacteria bacterium]|nr:hypothetical protein [Deltaproteobacteria bacterium]